MDGTDRRAGAVAGVFGPRNPVLAARAVMERSRHVLLIGEGALAFCREQGVVFCEPGYFHTKHAGGNCSARSTHPGRDPPQYGTVGAVARDRCGNLAAATSTGGMTGKAPGRVGDTPIIGAGTYADNATCAVSATGHGEFFIRHGAAFRNRRAPAPCRSIPGLGGADGHRRAGGRRRLRWCRRGRPRRRVRIAVQHRGDVSRLCPGRYGDPHRNLRRALPIG